MKRWFVGMTALGLACGGDSSGPGATSVTGVAGDNQSGTKGASLPVPLSFTALGSDGLPIEGVTVTWSATPTGAAAFAPTSGPTDANGIASTNVVLGATVGTITMQASLNGVSPVVFHATVLDPCSFITPVTFGQSINGALTTTDCLLFQGWYYDFYSLQLPSGQQNIRISMHGAGTFDDTYLDVFTNIDDLGRVAFDDDSILGQAGARNAQLDIITPGDTTYAIGANSYDQFETGDYTLATETRTSALNGCRPVWVMRGIAVTDTMKATDCADSSATPKYYEVARMVLFSGTVVTISEKSIAFNASLELYQFNPVTGVRTLIASNDDSLPGSNTNAFLQHTVAASNYHDIIISTSAGGETGAYTFEVSASTTLSPGTTGSPRFSSGRNNWWRGVTIPKRSKR
jgi:hypothetical protein